MQKKPLKIAYIVPYKFIPPMNGGQKAAFGMAEYLSNVVDLLCISTKNNLTEKAQFFTRPILSNSVVRYINLFSWPQLYKTLKDKQINFCITHQHFIFFLIWPLCKILGIKSGIYIQNLEYKRFQSMGKIYWKIIYVSEWIAYKLADYLFFISPDEIPGAVRTFNISIEKCIEIPYGVSNKKYSIPDKKLKREQLGLEQNKLLILFFGPLTYKPNLEALEMMLNHIEPQLKNLYPEMAYKFIICGGGLPDKYQNLRYSPTFDYQGFVEDIDSYIQACDVMLNPVISGGGVKTKLIESIAQGTTVISSKSGALGASPQVCEKKLVQVDDEDYAAYAHSIVKEYYSGEKATPEEFFNHFYWRNIINRLISRIESSMTQKT